MDNEKVIEAKCRGLITTAEYINWLHHVVLGVEFCNIIYDAWSEALDDMSEDTIPQDIVHEAIEVTLQQDEELFNHWAVHHRTEY